MTRFSYEREQNEHIIFDVVTSLSTLLPTPNWSPYIFTLVQKIKLVIKKSCFYKQTKALLKICKLFH